MWEVPTVGYGWGVLGGCHIPPGHLLTLRKMSFIGESRLWGKSFTGESRLWGKSRGSGGGRNSKSAPKCSARQARSIGVVT